MTKIKISEILELKQRVKEINSIPLHEIEWEDADGNVQKINQEILQEFYFTGLNNIDFIVSGFYLEGFST